MNLRDAALSVTSGSAAPPPPPPPSNDEIRRDSDQRIAAASGDAPRTVLYAPRVKDELDWGLQTNWAGYTLAEKPSGVLDVAYSGGDVYPTHPLVHEAKQILQALLGFPFVIDDEYGPLTADYIRKFQEMTGLTKLPGIQAGVLDETTFRMLRDTRICATNPDGCKTIGIKVQSQSASAIVSNGPSKDWTAEQRINFVKKFFRDFSGLSWYEWYDKMVSDGYGYGRAIVDFMQWESDSGRLQNSDWWRAGNGQMLDDMSAALDAWNSGQRHSDNTQVDLWLQYMSHPSQERLWAAHNADIAAGFKAAAPLLAREGSAEAQFAIYVTLRVLRMAPSVQADP